MKASNTVITLVSSGLSNPEGIAVDGNGNVYFSDSGDGEIKEWMSSSNTVNTIVDSSAGLFLPAGIALDASGNIYIADYGHGGALRNG